MAERIQPKPDNVTDITIGKKVITERASLRTGESLMKNYHSPEHAVLELVDNGVDNRLPGTPITIQVRVTPKDKEVFIRSDGGAGLDLEGLERFLNWGNPEKKGKQLIGRHGVGGKAAMGYLGKSIDVICSAQGSETAYRIYDPDWTQKGDAHEKQHPYSEDEAYSKEKGYFHLRIKNADKLPKPERLMSLLAETYRPLLYTGEVVLIVNGKKVEPLELEYWDDDEHKPTDMKLQNGFGDTTSLRLGVMEPGTKQKPGFRVYVAGRQMRTGEFFDMPDDKNMPQAARLMGEAHMDFLEVMTNKDDIVTDYKYKDTVLVLQKRVLKDFYDKVLSGLILEQHRPIEKYEREVMDRVKTIIDRVLPSLEKVDDEWFRKITETIVVQTGPEGTGGGGRIGKARGGENTGESGGRTTKKDALKRTAVFDSIEAVTLGDPYTRSAVVTEGDKRKLKINVGYDMYELKRQAGVFALEAYVAETAIGQLLRDVMVDRPVKEFSEVIDVCVAEIAKQLLKERSAPKKKGSTGTIYFNKRDSRQ